MDWVASMTRRCDFCHLDVNRSEFGSHVLRRHVDESWDSWKCGQCPYVAVNLDAISDHLFHCLHDPKLITKQSWEPKFLQQLDQLYRSHADRIAANETKKAQERGFKLQNSVVRSENVYTDEQMLILVNEFTVRNNLPEPERLTHLSYVTGLSGPQINWWFDKRRKNGPSPRLLGLLEKQRSGAMQRSDVSNQPSLPSGNDIIKQKRDVCKSEPTTNPTITEQSELKSNFINIKQEPGEHPTVYPPPLQGNNQNSTKSLVKIEQMEFPLSNTVVKRLSIDQLTALEIGLLMAERQTNPVLTRSRTSEIADMIGLTPECVTAFFSSKKDKKPVVSPVVKKESEKRSMSPEKRKILYDAFAKNPNPTQTQRDGISAAAGLTAFQVKTWFEWQRQKTSKLPDKKCNGLQPANNHNIDLIVTPAQRLTLKLELSKDPALGPNQMERIVMDTGLTESQVQAWFTKNRFTVQQLDLTKLKPELAKTDKGPATKSRKKLTEYQRNVLRNGYGNGSCDASKVQQLVLKTGLKSEQIRWWFSNRKRVINKQPPLPVSRV